jgi:hypothetical protein
MLQGQGCKPGSYNREGGVIFPSILAGTGVQSWQLQQKEVGLYTVRHHANRDRGATLAERNCFINFTILTGTGGANLEIATERILYNSNIYSANLSVSTERN